MCGRFTLASDTKELKAVFYLARDVFNSIPRYNIAPGQDVLTVTSGPAGRDISVMKWGLIPHWSKESKSGFKMINARAETIDQKPAFMGAFLKRRCLIPADGFYEWKKTGGTKNPLYITLANQKIFAFAGIWEYWKTPEGSVIYSCCIVTTAANDDIRAIHDRMPVILAGEREYSDWLKLEDTELLKKMLKPFHDKLSVYPVSSLVNSPKNEGKKLIDIIKA